MNDNGLQAVELYLKYRPKRFEDIIGQSIAVRTLERHLKQNKLPHAVFLTGPTGTGKTTIAYILRDALNCAPEDFIHIDCAATEKALETIIRIKGECRLAPMFGKVRLYYFDELQSFSRSRFGQEATLNMLERIPPHVYFILAAMDVSKVNKAIRGRCELIPLKALSDTDLIELVNTVAEKEGKSVPKTVTKRIVEVAEGSAREALVWLHKVIDIKDEQEQIATVVRTDVREQAITIARKLMQPKPLWGDVAGILRELKGEDPESLRRMVLGYASSCLIGERQPPPKRAYILLSAFESHFYDSGWPGFVSACYQVSVAQ